MKLLTQEYKEHWNTVSKLIFRALFTYFALYILLMLLNPLFEVPFRWIGKEVFKVNYEYEVSGNGSGDHTFAYLTLFVTVVLTLITVVIWSILDRNRKSYNMLFYWFLVFLRIVLVAVMLLYGFVKVFKLQFPSASLTHLLDPLGDFSPMGLAWTYMGFSKGFNVFVGFMEVLGGLLLIPRRTQTLGSFIIIGVMTQVAMMNFCYDIPVKLFSIHLVLMALVIFITDDRFLKVFIKNKAVDVFTYYHPVKNNKYHKVIFWIKSIGLFILVSLISFNFYTTESHRGNNREKPLLYGIWEASSFIKNGDTLQPLITDNYRWRYLIVDLKDKATVKTMDDLKYQYKFITDSTSQKIMIHKKDSETEHYNFSYKNPNSEFLELDGIIDSDTLHIIFSRKDHEKFNLNSRGFNWINERPYNR
ncbi:DoxX-like family protein [Aquimarina amphilecti]|uniref:DoxX-like family protein n=1 Tax=Aquimarina amphilecti TaxID=1038014 RepID=A0A1H7QKN6_AQUAM|nr:DoxX family protein [Aquimarina amphilecti]SEL48522.1 DoxX-like family protein [Aquimarina amphilecti]